MNVSSPPSRILLVTQALAIVVTIPLAFASSYVSVWGSMRWFMESGFAGGQASALLRLFGRDLGEFARRNGHYPRSPKELAQQAEQKCNYLQIDASGKIGFPAPYDKTFQYQATSRSYRVFSVGRDGEIGGLELRGDLDQNPDGRVSSEPTLREFLHESRYRGLLFCISVVTSVFAGVLSFVLSERLRECPGSPLIAVLSVIVILSPAHTLMNPIIFGLAWIWIICFFVARQMNSHRCLLLAIALSGMGIAASAVFGVDIILIYLLPVIWIIYFLLARQTAVRRYPSLLVVLSVAMMTICASAVSQGLLVSYMMVEYK